MASDNTRISDNAMHERSPSPALPPPIPTAPGPRASALQKLFSDASAHVVKTCSYNNFAACFPTPADHIPESLKSFHEQFTDRLGASLRTNFEAILVERNVIPSLNELDRLIEEARKRKAKAEEATPKGQAVQPPIPSHTLPARQLYLSHLAPSLSQHSEVIAARQQELQSDNLERLERVTQQRRIIQTLVKNLEDVVHDIDMAATAVRSEELDTLRDEARMMNEYIKS